MCYNRTAITLLGIITVTSLRQKTLPGLDTIVSKYDLVVPDVDVIGEEAPCVCSISLCVRSENFVLVLRLHLIWVQSLHIIKGHVIIWCVESRPCLFLLIFQIIHGII
ncbi:uncharacterized protein EI90DRAFT_3081697 [Cantharellus anzutake]|uniref:uncharacterized protein n=1 Tax=Cantharellus anzutake TaxID=1750568 RepID=UPI001902EF16|nr:uncharacterized protein EI90DRAFT_3081697 [Cantharellus anzutake]KAF8319866.1 hypothetical protein EI90DRAFT_3081697 [Cantharellus anzutake]